MLTIYAVAEGNGDSVSAAMQAERLAFLATMFTQNQGSQVASPPVSSMGQQQQQHHNVNQAFPRSPAPPPSVPFPSSVSAHRASFAGALPQSQPQFHQQYQQSHQLQLQQQQQMQMQSRFAVGAGARLSNHHALSARRSNSTPEMPSGNVVYQTPVSPSRATFPSSEEHHQQDQHHQRNRAQTQMQTTYLLPSFLKNEITIKPNLTRTPLSLSPLSSSSAELSFDDDGEEEEDDEEPSLLSSPSSVAGGMGVGGSGVGARSFYAQSRKAGSNGRLSNSSGSDSTSSLTLAGGSIWSIGCDEDKKWNAAATAGNAGALGAIGSPVPDFLTSRSRKSSIEPFKHL